MVIIPAIDLKGGKCVRLSQGREEKATVYSADPLTIAKDWIAQGAHRLHVVNLDGAFGYASENGAIMRSIAEFPGTEVQFGGGLRNLEAIDQAIAAGAAKVVLGTLAIESQDLLAEAVKRHGSDRIIVALDSVDGKVAIRGWTVTSALSVMAVVRVMKGLGVQEILYTDILRDGMMSGPDLLTIVRLADEGMRVLSSGGISSIEDIRAIRNLRHDNITGVIIGKALYEGRLKLKEVIDEIAVGGAA
jgi:phosphoribosylformimino-5-aminoimidazole carboxamide ribotide isomerase